MERQNITLSLPTDLLKKAKHLAVDRGTSLSGLLAGFIERLIREEDARARAARRLRARLKAGLDLGTNGRAEWSRDDLHGR